MLAPRSLVLLFLLVAGLFPARSGAGEAKAPASGPRVPVLQLQSVGSGSRALGGAWQFHTGDDRAWAAPGFDDSGWEQISAGETWGAQTHPSYAGFAWYRRHLQVSLVPGAKPPLSLLMPAVDDAYEVYWNGELVGGFGKLPPHALWYPGQPRAFALPSGSAASGVLAVRVWKAPLASNDPATLGGLNGPPLLGDASSIATESNLASLQIFHGHLYDYARILILITLAVAALLLWLRNRGQRLLLWFGLFLISRMAVFIFGSAQIAIWLPISRSTILLQGLVPIQDVTLWLVLIWLFGLRENKRLLRWAVGIFLFDLAMSWLDGVLLGFLWEHVGPTLQWLDASFTLSASASECFLFVLIYEGFKRKLEPARSIVAWSAALVGLLYIVANAASQGMRFTHLRLTTLLTHPIAGIPGTSPMWISEFLLVLALLYAVAHAFSEQERRESAAALEILSAREVQKILIPEAIPSVEGYSISSIYRPAQEVGGDFFQIIPLSDGTTLIVLGDVSGKGLKAAMIVSLIVGTLRTFAEFYQTPAAILCGLNRRLVGRMEDGFTSCLVLKLAKDGSCTVANAGHHAPFQNGRELDIAGSLPLGIAPDCSYEEQRFSIAQGDTLMLYTDGVLEARDARAELFGYDRLDALLAKQPSARGIADEACAFGQQDDVTVLTIHRLGAHQEPREARERVAALR